MTISTPTGVERGRVALHTASGLRCRRRKGLEPSRRLSETTGPQSPSAFRIVVPAAEVTKCGARCKRPAAFFTRRAPEPAREPVRYRDAPALPHMFRRTAERRAHVPAAQAWAVQAPMFKAMALRSLATASAGAGGAPVTAASAARVRWAEGAAVNSGVDGTVGSPRIASGQAVLSTLPDAATAAPTWKLTVASARPRTAVRMPVRGEAGIGEARGAWLARRGDARCRRS